MSEENSKNKKEITADLIEVMQHSNLFSEIDHKAYNGLISRLERVTLEAGETLFKQDDPSDAIYVVVDGQLTAHLLTREGKHKIVGTVEKGETVGELGALSQQKRSLTVSAVVDTRLLKMDNQNFRDFCYENQSFISKVIDLIIARSQNTLKLISQKKHYKHIAIVSGNQFANMTHFIEKLKENLEGNENIIVLDEEASETLSVTSEISNAERQNKAVIFILTEHNFKKYQSKLNHVSGVYVVTDGDVYTPLSDFALKLLQRIYTPFANQYDIVLMHDKHAVVPLSTREWLKDSDFTLHHHIQHDNNQDYQRLLRFMQGKAIGLVLGGGGQRGWAGIGVIKALREANIPIDAIGGTSVGAVAAGCYAKYLDYYKTRSAFKKNSIASTHFFAINKLTLPIISIITSKSQTKALMNEFQTIQTEDLWIPFFAITTNLSTGKEVVNRKGMLWEQLRASASLPGIAPPVVVDGELHYDGGLLNNLPTDQMRTLVGTEGTVIAVKIVSQVKKPIHYNFPPIISFWLALMKIFKLGYRNLKFPPFVYTFFSALMVGASAKEKNNELEADVLIAPDLSKHGLLHLKKNSMNEMTEIGYQSALEQLRAARLIKK